MPRSEMLTIEGTVVDCLPSSRFSVKLDETGTVVTCTLSGKLRLNYIRVLNGDKVTVEMSPYDLTKGRIIWRNK
jgi:translation initiation factor IF-1